ncbi:hypothetical protein AMTR_s00010p00263600 [Amborella trichopoda]|uniref:Glucose-methanol-choline oxidoreductase C-terminal domain-containing protein n=1 Tax=Amborella trichopoda TaxID=13333 RepID=W1NH31_AMBTC|nr:hypothetical protein AMTR_s00010p00263600 [Amborella trichopoda]
MADDYTSIVQSFDTEDGVPNLRGRVLGGSTAINRGFYSRTSKDYIERVGWDEELVRESYEWVESQLVLQTSLLTPWQAALKEGHVKAGSFRGRGSQKDHCFAEFYSRKSHISRSRRSNLISRSSRKSPNTFIKWNRPLNHLQAFNISPIIALLPVGQGFQGNPCISIRLPSPNSLKPEPPQVVGITHNYQTIIQALILPTTPTGEEILSVIVGKVAEPLSRGLLSLKSRDPRQNPSVKFNYLKEERDLEGCIKAGQLIDRIYRTGSFRERVTESDVESWFKFNVSDSKEMGEFCKMNVRTCYHYHAGCEVGSVIDEEFWVFWGRRFESC